MKYRSFFSNLISATIILLILIQTFNFKEIWSGNFEFDKATISLLMMVVYLIAINVLPKRRIIFAFEVLYVSIALILMPPNFYNFFLIFIPIIKLLSLSINLYVFLGMSIITSMSIHLIYNDKILTILFLAIINLFFLQNKKLLSQLQTLEARVSNFSNLFKELKLASDKFETEAKISSNLFNYKKKLDESADEGELVYNLAKATKMIFNAEAVAVYVFEKGKYTLFKIFGDQGSGKIPNEISFSDGFKIKKSGDRLEVPINYEGEPYARLTIIGKRSVIETNRSLKIEFTASDLDIIRMLEDTIEFKINEFKVKYRLFTVAYNDDLTGLPNRVNLETRIFQTFYNKAYKRKQRLFVFIIDIDDFKGINDVYGHTVGDEVLRGLGIGFMDFIKSSGRDDIIARWGGEEFVALVIADTEEEAREIAEEYRRFVQSVDFPQRQVTISLGACEIEVTNKGMKRIEGGSTDSKDQLNEHVDKADNALYKAKESGKNKVIFYNDISGFKK